MLVAHSVGARRHASRLRHVGGHRWKPPTVLVVTLVQLNLRAELKAVPLILVSGWQSRSRAVACWFSTRGSNDVLRRVRDRAEVVLRVA